MAVWDRSKALAAFEAFGLAGTNAALAVYWLSLWRDGAPPRRSDFNPARVKDLLPAIALGEMRRDGDVVCRLSGHIIDRAFGAPMRGVSLVCLVEGEARQLRAARLRAVADGSVGLSRIKLGTAGDSDMAETIQLPFYGVQEDGSTQYVTHTDWRPTGADVREARPRAMVPDDYRAVGLV